MRVYKQNGTKERLFEMMTNVNKGLIKEGAGFDYHDAEMDHLGQQDLAADQAESPENHNNGPVMDHPSQIDFDDKQQTGIKETVDYNQFSDQQFDQLYTKMFGHPAYHMSREGYIHALSGQGENPNGFEHEKAVHLNQQPFSK